MAYTQEFKEKVTDDLKEIGDSLDGLKSIGDRLDKIAEYTDPNNPEGLGKATDLLFEHVRNQDAVNEIRGHTSNMKNFTMFLKVMAVTMIGTMVIFGVQFYLFAVEHPEPVGGIYLRDYLPSTPALILCGIVLTAFAGFTYNLFNVQLFKKNKI